LKPGGDLVIIAVNVGETPEKIRPWAAKRSYNLPILMDADEAFSKFYEVFTMPQTFVVQNGRMVRHSGGFMSRASLQGWIRTARESELK
jgi:hypothetical protein